MPGYLLTESAAGRSNKLHLASHLRALMPHLAVGVLAGVAAAQIRLHPGIPGHKALFWMVPVLCARLRYRHIAGATVGVSLAACVSLGLGGNLAGGWLGLALLPAAGAILDCAIAFGERTRLSPAVLILLLAPAGMVANLVCAAKRLAAPSFVHHAFLGLGDPLASIVSYALVGLACGLMAGAMHLGWTRALRGKRGRGRPA